jgi:hypothetical protein
MTIILCLDDKNGLSFNNRRQSRDKILIEDIIQNDNVYILEHSAYLFAEYSVNKVNNVSDLPNDAVYFHEITDPQNIIDQFDTVIIYRWNRHYPSDVKFELNLNQYDKVQEKEFVGFSHDKITKEVYNKL